MNEIVFMFSLAPLVAVPAIARSCGFNVLLCESNANNGAVSSVLNFMMFGFGCVGMVLCTLPRSDFIIGLTMVTTMCSAAYLDLWLFICVKGTLLASLR